MNNLAYNGRLRQSPNLRRSLPEYTTRNCEYHSLNARLFAIAPVWFTTAVGDSIHNTLARQFPQKRLR